MTLVDAATVCASAIAVRAASAADKPVGEVELHAADPALVAVGVEPEAAG